MVVRPAIFDIYVLAVNVTSFGKRVTKGSQLALVITGRLGIQKSNQGH
ncbi:MAG TPA: hypothetical protein VK776_28660 [Bryobacteraceae bacterium]|nr:hypothetical protein [Bryobacteraceae bacterium]